MTAASGFDGLSDAELLELAGQALSDAVAARPGSAARYAACAEHERIARELAQRLQGITGRRPGETLG